jgi:SH3-like domain-containing protein
MQSPTRSFFLLLAFLLALTSACTTGQFPEQRLEAKASEARAQQDSTVVAAIVKAKKANLRERPYQSATVVNTVNKDDLLFLTGARNGPWYQIRDSKTGTESWIHGSTIALLQAVETGSSTTTSTQASGTTSASVQRPRKVSPQASSPSRPAVTRTQPASGRSYINRDGIRVPSPVFSDTRPAGASARCRDGSYSFSLNRRGTCSRHGGVAEWY